MHMVLLDQVGEASQEQQKTAADEGPATVSSPTAASPTSAPDAFADLLGSVGAPQQPLQPQAAPNPGSGARPTDSPTEEERPAAEAGGTWVPLQLALGLPLVPEALNQLVCSNAMVRRLCLISPDPPPSLTNCNLVALQQVVDRRVDLMFQSHQEL